MPTLARQLGFSSVVVGTIYTILPIVGMLAKPTFGAIADRFHRQKLLFLLFQVWTLNSTPLPIYLSSPIFQVLTIVPFFAIMFIPAIPQESKVNFSCNDGFNALKYCPAAGEEGVKECAVSAIEADHFNSTLTCDLTCTTTESMWTIICDHWKIPLMCQDHRKDPLHFITESRIDKNLEVVNGCLHVVVERGDFPLTQESSTLLCPAAKQTVSARSITTQCDITCNNAEINALIGTSKIPDSEVTGLYQFWLFFGFLVLSWAGMAVVVTVGDAICFEMLADRPHLYGNQRLWGAVGWGTISLFSGLLVDEFSRGKSYKDYSVVFYMMLVLIGLDMVVSKKLKYSQTKLSTNIMRDVGTLLKSFRVVIFLSWCVVVGLCTALVWNFLFWHLEDLAAKEEGFVNGTLLVICTEGITTA